MKQIKLYTTAEQISAATDAFKRKGVSLQNEAHRLACSVLAHFAETKNTHVITNFLNAMPDAMRANACRAWFEAFGPVIFDKKGPRYVADGKTRLANAMQTPFWRFKSIEGVEYKPVDVEKLLDAAIKRLQKDEKETGRSHSATILALRCAPTMTAPASEQNDNDDEQPVAAAA